jgi:hypothetical protein
MKIYRGEYAKTLVLRELADHIYAKQVCLLPCGLTFSARSYDSFTIVLAFLPIGP